MGFPPRKKREAASRESVEPTTESLEVSIVTTTTTSDSHDDETDSDIELSPELSKRVPLSRLRAIAVYGRYELLGRIAFGGMAEIFLARESSTSGAMRYVVIKRVLPNVAHDPRFIRMFVDESSLAMRLNHPNICYLYEVGKEQGRHFLAMEWINGVRLTDLMRRAAQRKERIPPAIAAKIVSVVAGALDYAHRARDEDGRPMGIVHRDVTPQNIMISYDGAVKLLDFGVAKAESRAVKTKSGVIKGKLAYMSPQQCRGLAIDSRTDIFALGVCLYECVTGRRLYRRANEFDTMMAIIDEPCPSIREVDPALPAELDEIIQKAVEKAPEDRFSTASEMQEALESFLARSGAVVTLGKIADYLAERFKNEIESGPRVETEIMDAPQAAPPPTPKETTGELSRVEARTVSETKTAAPARSRLLLPLGVLAIVGLAAVGFVAFGQLGAGESSNDDETPVAAGAEPSESTQSASSASEENADRGHPASAPAGGEAEGATSSIAPPGGAMEAATESPSSDEGAPAAEEADRGEESRRTMTAQRRPRERGSLAINTTPWSRVYLGRRLLGQTPLEATVPSGRSRLKLVDPEGHTFYRTVEVRPNGTSRVSFELSR